VSDAPTTRTPRADPNRPATPPTSRAARRAEAQRGSIQNREIESWLGELRSGNGAPAGGPIQPSAEPKRAMPERPAPRKAQPPARPVDEPTTAIPTQRRQDPGATEKIDTRQATDDEPKRRGGGVSAADLLRREGRL
jgi:RND superfamily putative drug exporter